MLKVVRHTSQEDDEVPDSEGNNIGLVTTLLFSFLYSNSHLENMDSVDDSEVKQDDDKHDNSVY